MFIVPYHVDVPMRRIPWMNWVLIAVTVFMYPVCMTPDGDYSEVGEALTFGGTSWLGYVGHVFVHRGIFHLLGNMLFLWLFGNAVCAKIGNLIYPLVYFLLAFLSGTLYYLIDPRPLIGASGAINGVVGMFVVWYMLNDISVWYFVTLRIVGTFAISSYWMVLLWFVFDLWGAIADNSGVAYLAHVFGVISGFCLAILLLKLNLIQMDRGEASLLDVWTKRHTKKRKKKKRKKSLVQIPETDD